jgi:hypothetical protein
MATALKTFMMMIKMKLISTMMTPAAATTRIQKMKWQKKRTKHCQLLTHISVTLVALFLSHNCLGCNLWTCTNKTHTIIRIMMQEETAPVKLVLTGGMKITFAKLSHLHRFLVSINLTIHY